MIMGASFAASGEDFTGHSEQHLSWICSPHVDRTQDQGFDPTIYSINGYVIISRAELFWE